MDKPAIQSKPTQGIAVVRPQSSSTPAKVAPPVLEAVSPDLRSASVSIEVRKKIAKELEKRRKADWRRKQNGTQISGLEQPGYQTKREELRDMWDHFRKERQRKESKDPHALAVLFQSWIQEGLPVLLCVNSIADPSLDFEKLIEDAGESFGPQYIELVNRGGQPYTFPDGTKKAVREIHPTSVNVIGSWPKREVKQFGEGRLLVKQELHILTD